MSFLSNIGDFLGNVFGSNDEKKKKQQQLQQPQQRQVTPSFIQNVQPQQNDQSQPQQSNDQNQSSNKLNLVLNNQNNDKNQKPVQNTLDTPKIDANTLIKAKQISQQNTTTPTTTAAAPTPDNRSLLQKITHNPVTDIVGGAVKLPLQFAENYSNTFANLGRKAAGVDNATIQNNMGTDPVNRALLKASGATGKNTQLASDVAQIGTSIVAPGVDSAAENAAAKILPTATNAALRKVAPRVVSNAAIGGAFNAEGAAGEGASNKDILKAAGEGALAGGVLGGATSSIPLLRKANAERQVGSSTVDNSAPGLSSVNPNQEIDAAKATAQSIAQEQAQTLQTGAAHAANDINLPAYLRKADKAAQAADTAKQTDQAAKDMGLGDTVIDTTPAFQHKNNIQAVIDQGNAELNDWANANPDHTPQQLDEAKSSIQNQVVENIAKMQQEREAALATPPATSEVRAVQAAPVPETPAAAPAATAIPAPAPATVAPSAPLQTSGEPTVAALAGQNTRPEAALQTAIEEAHNVGDNAKVAELIQQLPPEMQPPMRSALGIPEPTPVQTVDVAPRTHDALVKQLGPSTDMLNGKYSQRAPVNIEDLKQNASASIANMNDGELLQAFATTGPETMVHDSQSFALARAALERLSQQSDNPTAVQTVTNIMDAMDRYVSRSGEGLRVAQEEFDNMPVPMKVRYIVKKIDSANADTKNYTPLADDPAKAAVVEANINGYLQGSQTIAERIAQMQGQLNDIADSALNGKSNGSGAQAIIKSLKTEERNLAKNNGDLVKYYSELVPGRSGGQKINDFARRMMLASFTGRVNDVITTSANVANLGAQNVTQGLLAKAINLVRPGTVTDTLRGAKSFVRGTAEGIRRTGGEIKGNQYTGSLQKALQSNTEDRSGLQKTGGPVGRTIQAATEFATNASSGVREQRLYQLAIQEGQKSGLKGELLTQYAEARSAVPTRQMLEQADQLHKEVNNLNENPVTRALNRVASGIEGKSAVGGFIKNQVMPFTSWLGGNIYNSITDKNVIASSIKLLDSARKGDAEGIVRNLAKTANNAAYTYALGYLLTKSGVITNQDAQGYNDGGAYLHVGDRYIPVAFTGFIAPSIILGNAAYNGLNNSNGGSPSQKIADAVGQGLSNMLKNINANSAIGADNNLSRSLSALNNGGIADAGSTLASGAAGQFIPALSGDVNATLNNGLKIGNQTIVPDSLNPTHEASNTKVENPNSPSGHAKDVPKSALRSLENRIPGVSQQLPRKAGVAASDLVDRTTRGNRDTQTSIDTRAQAKAKVDQATDFKKRDIPNYNNKGFDDAVEARVERGEYSKAIEAVQAKLDAQKKDKNIPDKKNKALEDQITQYKVLKDGNFDPSIRDLYKSTSLTEWRNMGDPESDTYDPKTYQKLYDYDNALAKAGISGSSLAKDSNKYMAKTTKSKSAKSAADKAAAAALKKAQSNTIGSTPDLGKISLGDLAPQKAGSVKIPTIQQVKAGELIKKRQISVK